MKLWKWFLKCPLLFLLLAGWAGLTVYTFTEGKMPEALKDDFVQNPVFTALLEPDAGLSDPVLKDWENTLAADDETEPEEPDEKNTKADTAQKGKKSEVNKENPKDGNTGSKDRKDSKKDGKKADNEGSAKEEEAGVTRYESYDKQQTDSPYYSDPGMKALTTDYAYEKVDKSYFDDAVFIGDSRTEGMQNYSGLDNAGFFAKTGLNVYELLDDDFITDPSTGRQVSVTYMLKHNSYKKIYFMIGINELGTGNTGTFQKAYERVIGRFRKWQPDAVIYIQGILPVSKSKSTSDPIFNNININDKNVAISRLADGKNIFYFDVSGELTDKKGNLKAEYTFDDVHMYAQYYSYWTDFLMEHGVVRKEQ